MAPLRGGALHPFPVPVVRARGTGLVAALTFDDGPHPGQTDRLLDVLAANAVKATFCVVADNVRAPGGAAVLRRIVAEGHTLGSHSVDYADLGTASADRVEDVMVRTLLTIRAALGDPTAEVPYFRAPNGSLGVTSAVAVTLGMQPLGLGNVIDDWDACPDRSVETLTANLRRAIAPGAVVLVHDGGGDRTTSIDAVARVLPEKIAAGWTFTLPVGGVPDPSCPVPHLR